MLPSLLRLGDGISNHLLLEHTTPAINGVKFSSIMVKSAWENSFNLLYGQLLTIQDIFSDNSSVFQYDQRWSRLDYDSNSLQLAYMGYESTFLKNPSQSTQVTCDTAGY